MQHRLITFICKNPPNEAAGTPSKKWDKCTTEFSLTDFKMVHNKKQLDYATYPIWNLFLMLAH